MNRYKRAIGRDYPQINFNSYSENDDGKVLFWVCYKNGNVVGKYFIINDLIKGNEDAVKKLLSEIAEGETVTFEHGHVYIGTKMQKRLQDPHFRNNLRLVLEMFCEDE